MSKQEKITATEARIPLANLTLSPMNPRQNVTEAEVADMAESLYAAGLIQYLAARRFALPDRLDTGQIVGHREQPDGAGGRAAAARLDALGRAPCRSG